MGVKAEKIYLYYCDISRCVLADDVLLSYLNKDDKIRFKAYTSAARKRQFGMGRWAIKQGLKRIYGLPETHQYQLLNHQDWVEALQSRSFSVSISHSGDYVAVLIADAGVRLGVDVEKHKVRNYAELLEGFATEDERKLVINSSSPKHQFYRLWTAKEALLKATQKSLLEIGKEDMSVCFFHTDCLVAEHCYAFNLLANDSYSLSVISNKPFALNRQELLSSSNE
jgi:4'-phosphopantetheinyl transferase